MENIKKKFNHTAKDDYKFNRKPDGSGVKPATDNGYRYDEGVEPQFPQQSGRPSYSEVPVVSMRLQRLLDEVEHGIASWRTDALMEHLLDNNAPHRKLYKPPITRDETIAPTPKVTIHAERVFTFSDGTEKRICPVQDCSWGQSTGSGFRQKHSDGLTFVIPPDDDVVEVDADDPKELDPKAFEIPSAPVREAGDDSPDGFEDEVSDENLPEPVEDGEDEETDDGEDE